MACALAAGSGADLPLALRRRSAGLLGRFCGARISINALSFGERAPLRQNNQVMALFRLGGNG